MNIVVCIKQVPDSNNIEVDEKTGSLIRANALSKINPYDLFAIESAIKIKELLGGNVTALTMGPKQAEAMIYDVYTMGVDDGVILSDKKFAGSDVLATSYTLAQGIKLLKDVDLIICGKQTTDGDTAQIGPAIAEHLGIPHGAWVKEISKIDSKTITIKQEFGNITQTSSMPFPCLISVEQNICVPRLPSYLLKQKTKSKQIRYISFDDLLDKDLSRYGLVGSPTTVEKMFPPKANEKNIYIEASTPTEKAKILIDNLKNKKII